MQTEKFFKTKTGYCHILPDKIVLTRKGVIGEISKITVGNSISRILIFYILISLSLLYFAYGKFQKNDSPMALLYIAVSIYIIYSTFKSLNNSATPIIERSKIQSVKFIPAKPGVTRAYFKVLFQDNIGKTKTRLIMLPGSLNNGEYETDNAVKIMTEENLITNG